MLPANPSGTDVLEMFPLPEHPLSADPHEWECDAPVDRAN